MILLIDWQKRRATPQKRPTVPQKRPAIPQKRPAIPQKRPAILKNIRYAYNRQVFPDARDRRTPIIKGNMYQKSLPWGGLSEV